MVSAVGYPPITYILCGVVHSLQCRPSCALSGYSSYPRPLLLIVVVEDRSPLSVCSPTTPPPPDHHHFRMQLAVAAPTLLELLPGYGIIIHVRNTKKEKICPVLFTLRLPYGPGFRLFI